jgi:hypothetical protein
MVIFNEFSLIFGGDLLKNNQSLGRNTKRQVGRDEHWLRGLGWKHRLPKGKALEPPGFQVSIHCHHCNPL